MPTTRKALCLYMIVSMLRSPLGFTNSLRQGEPSTQTLGLCLPRSARLNMFPKLNPTASVQAMWVQSLLMS